jgi:hypothetical protein
MTTTNILILASNEMALGAIQSLSITERRSENGSVSATLKITRMRMDRLRLNETFQDSKFLVASQIYPVHIVVIEDKVETIRATNVWITSIAVSYATDEWILSEGIEAECEFVTGTRTYESSSE